VGPITYGAPDLYPLSLDVEADRVRIVRLDETGYREASFLDERILPHTGPGIWTAWTELAAASRALSGESDFIFHIGHVGSTLLARLLGESERILALREPAMLRTLAAMDWPVSEPYLETVLRLYARVFRSGQRSLIKATSFVSELALPMMDRSPSARAILMFVSPLTYLATILAGPASRAALTGAAPGRIKRLRGRLGAAPWSVGDLSEGELAAMGWACEICALAAIAARHPERVRWLDFDEFLARPAAGLTSVLRFLHGEAPHARVETMLRGPHFHQYSKAPEHPYDAEVRRRILAEGLAENRVEIERGLRWLNDVGNAHPGFASAARSAAAGRGF
jgi:hypothetical protein